MKDVYRLMATVLGCTAVFAGTSLLTFGVYALIQGFATDEPKAKSIYKGCAPLLLLLGLPSLILGIIVLRRCRRISRP